MTLKTVDIVTAGRTEQLGRRNLTDEQRTVLIGKMYEARKNTHGGDRKSSTQNGNLNEPQRVSDQIAQELGIAKNTVIRAERFSKGMDKIAEVSPEAERSRKEVTTHHMVDLRKRRVGLEDALVMFEAESKPILKEAARHAHFTPDRQKRQQIMHRRSKNSKGKRR